jgi:hypothetical protein
MNVIRGLAREHAAFAYPLKRLEMSAAGDEATARREARNALLILLSALEKHEMVEVAVFGDPCFASGEDAARIANQVELQHQRIRELRLEFMEAIAASDAVPIQRLEFLERRIADSLRTQFQDEEERLWPRYENVRRSCDALIRRRLERGVKAVESDIAATSAAISEYLDARR